MSSNEENNLELDKPECSTSSASDVSKVVNPTVEDIGPEANRTESETTEAVTMLDVLEDEKELEEDARAVLGGADERNCSYNDKRNEGYLKRQALYACETCSVPNAPDFSPAGICLACSYACHNDHKLVELYTKRGFRCDCGNSKLPKSNPCKLFENKAAVNEKNQYNQNYRGVYCTCHRPYPDEEDTVPDAMIQCALCEDWFHRRHLQVAGEKPPCDSAFAEMICHLCSEKHNSFLFAYEGHSVSSVKKDANGEELDLSIEISEDNKNSSLNESLGDNSSGEVGEKSTLSCAEESKEQGVGEKEKEQSGNSCFLKRAKVESIGKEKPTALFMLQGWREQLCRCIECTKMYQEHCVDFLLDPEDTVHYYERKTETDKGSQYEEGMKALSEMDRTKQIEAIHGYNSMKSNLMDYLKKFAENKKVVREEDIQEFFKQMAGNKRRKVSIPDSCK